MSRAAVLSMSAICTIFSVLLAGCDSDAVKDAKQAAAANLRDPNSAQFRNMREGKNYFVCGEINGTNGYGGYTGFKRFYAIGKTAWIENDIFDPTVNEAHKLCPPVMP